jgi:Fur family zinc uptake transcriptional regulator
VIGLNLTPARRAILDLLCSAGKPLGAYDMLDSLTGPSGRRPAPIAVYRALDYLLENGLVHRLASRNAFVACGRRHAHSDPVVFLICDACGKVEESASQAFALSLAETAAAAGFRSNGAVVEVSGACASCAAGSVTRDAIAKER